MEAEHRLFRMGRDVASILILIEGDGGARR
jgi:hypothetical protein